MTGIPLKPLGTASIARLSDPDLFAANAASQIGNIMTAVGVPWFFLITTGSAARTGVDLVAGHGCTAPPARTACTTSATPWAEAAAKVSSTSSAS